MSTDTTTSSFGVTHRLVTYSEDPEVDQMVYKHTSFFKFDDDGTAYYGRTSIPERQISDQQRADCLKLVPDEEIYPLVPSGFAEAPSVLSNEYFWKWPKLGFYGSVGGTKTIAEMFLEEAKTLEFIRLNPHPNISHFAGCAIKDNRIIGLIFPRYSVTLGDRVKKDDSGSLDKDSCLRGIVAGLEHLHSIGLAHNDFNPQNIMLNEEDVPIIIDFGSCKPLGYPLREAGTVGWTEDFDRISSFRNDETGLRKIRQWLADPEAYVIPPFPSIWS